MNQEDMDRYFWRTGRRWSGGDRPLMLHEVRPKLTMWTILLLAAAFVSASWQSAGA